MDKMVRDRDEKVYDILMDVIKKSEQHVEMDREMKYYDRLGEMLMNDFDKVLIRHPNVNAFVDKARKNKQAPMNALWGACDTIYRSGLRSAIFKSYELLSIPISHFFIPLSLIPIPSLNHSLSDEISLDIGLGEEETLKSFLTDLKQREDTEHIFDILGNYSIDGEYLIIEAPVHTRWTLILNPKKAIEIIESWEIRSRFDDSPENRQRIEKEMAEVINKKAG